LDGRAAHLRTGDGDRVGTVLLKTRSEHDRESGAQAECRQPVRAFALAAAFLDERERKEKDVNDICEKKHGDENENDRLLATTTVIVLELLAGGLTDLMHGGTDVVAGQPVVDVLAHLGYPAYLLTILGLWKLSAGIALLAPGFPRLKEWAYAGAFFVYTGAAASGMVRGHNDPSTLIWGPLIFAAITIASWALRPQSRTLGVLFPTKKLA
jgi:uncharacterized membrane protein YphA (DoxX/SURF4 family)